MNRRKFFLSIVVCLALPKTLFAKYRSDNELVVKNGWILMKEDF